MRTVFCNEVQWKIGYHLEPRHVYRSDQLLRSKRLRRALGDELKMLFPDHVAVTLSWRGARSIVCIDNTFMVSILFCSQEKIRNRYSWAVRPAPAERDCITVLCLLNPTHDRVLQYYVAPRLGQWNYLRCVGTAHSYVRRSNYFASQTSTLRSKGFGKRDQVSGRKLLCRLPNRSRGTARSMRKMERERVNFSPG